MSRECDRRPSGEQKDADAMRRQRVANAKPGGLAKQLKVESASKVSKAKQEAPEVSRQRLKLLIKRGEESAEQLAALDAATAAREVRQKKITAAVVRACASESVESQGEVQAAAARAHWAAKCATTEAAASEQLLQSRRIEIEEIRVARKKRAVAGSIPKGEGEEWKKGFDRQIASRERQQYLKAFQGYQRCRSKKQKVRVEVHPEVQEVRPEVQAAVSNFVQLGKVQEIEEVENLLAIERAGICLEGASFEEHFRRLKKEREDPEGYFEECLIAEGPVHELYSSAGCQFCHAYGISRDECGHCQGAE
jgi:hypothetical protein